MKNISLNGQWELSYCDIGTGSIREIEGYKSYPYCVPGDVHTALVESHVIEDPLLDKNSEHCRWMEEKEYWCRKRIILAEQDLLQKTVIVFEGLDCTADIWVNHVRLGRHSNSFVETEFDITNIIHPGENTIVVRLDQGLREVADKDLRTMPRMWNNEQVYRSYMRKPQYVYGWDWTIWLATCGIWRDVSIRSYDQAHLKELYAYSSGDVLEENQAAVITIESELEVLSGKDYLLEYQVYGDERYEEHPVCSASACQEVSADQQKMSLTISNAKLWWSNGTGNPYLYRIQVLLKDTDGAVLDVREQKLGIRSVRLWEPELENGETAFTFILNGEPVFCKGANHVPADCLFGSVTKEKTRELISLARESHMNMLRVWGGGIYASDCFMEACDQAGILVWHDFMFACGYYPDYDPVYMENVKTEAVKAIKRLRNHASLIGWSGNNEIQEMYYSQKTYDPELTWYGRSIFEELLPDLVKRYCKDVIYRESSPHGGSRGIGMEHGDQHFWRLTHVPDSDNFLDLWRHTDYPMKFLSEFGIMGAMNLESAKKCITEQHLNPEDEVWLHHTNSCMEHQLLNKIVEKYFGDYKNLSIQQFILRSQVIQAEITRHIYDEFRCRKFTCSGLLFWTLSDSFGIHNWSLVDYYLQKKPVYHYLKRSMAPLAIAIRGYEVQNTDGVRGYREYWKSHPEPLELWVTNDTLAAREIEVEYRVMTITGHVLQQGRKSCMAGKNSAQLVETVPVDGIDFIPEETILYTRIRKGQQLLHENRYFFAPFSKMAVKNAHVSHSLCKTAEDTYELTLNSDRFVWLLHLEATEETCYSDNDFDLLPGMPRTVTVVAKTKEFMPVMHWIEDVTEG